MVPWAPKAFGGEQKVSEVVKGANWRSAEGRNTALEQRRLTVIGMIGVVGVVLHSG